MLPPAGIRTNATLHPGLIFLQLLSKSFPGLAAVWNKVIVFTCKLSSQLEACCERKLWGLKEDLYKKKRKKGLKRTERLSGALQHFFRVKQWRRNFLEMFLMRRWQVDPSFILSLYLHRWGKKNHYGFCSCSIPQIPRVQTEPSGDKKSF